MDGVGSSSDSSAGQIIDLGEKLNSAANQMRVATLTGVDEEQCQLNKANKDASKATVEVLQGLMTQVGTALWPYL